jgi:hypothetical protein
MSHNSLIFLDKRHISARLLINKALYGQGLQSAKEQLTGRNKQAKKYTEMKPSLSEALVTPISYRERKKSWRRHHRGNPCHHRPPGPILSIVCSTSRESTLLSRLGSKGAVQSRGREAHSEHTRTIGHVSKEGLSIVTSSSRHPRTPPPPASPPIKRDINCRKRTPPKMR